MTQVFRFLVHYIRIYIVIWIISQLLCMGYHVYNAIWSATVREELQCVREVGNAKDRYVISPMWFRCNGALTLAELTQVAAGITRQISHRFNYCWRIPPYKYSPHSKKQLYSYYSMTFIPHNKRKITSLPLLGTLLIIHISDITNPAT